MINQCLRVIKAAILLITLMIPLAAGTLLFYIAPIACFQCFEGAHELEIIGQPLDLTLCFDCAIPIWLGPLILFAGVVLFGITATFAQAMNALWREPTLLEENEELHQRLKQIVRLDPTQDTAPGDESKD